MSTTRAEAAAANTFKLSLRLTDCVAETGALFFATGAFVTDVEMINPGVSAGVPEIGCTAATDAEEAGVAGDGSG